MSETVSISLVKGTIKKGERKGQEWQGVSIKIGEFQKLIFVGNDSPIKTNFEMKYISQVLTEEGMVQGGSTE